MTRIRRILALAAVAAGLVAQGMGLPAPASTNRAAANPAFAIRVSPPTAAVATNAAVDVRRDGWYYDCEHVVAYLRAYGCLPGNYITKDRARQLGWVGGPLEPYAPGKAIGGDWFGNYERRLPRGDWRECDLDTRGRSRGTRRLIYSRDARDRRFYYTGDHYRTFRRIP